MLVLVCYVMGGDGVFQDGVFEHPVVSPINTSLCYTSGSPWWLALNFCCCCGTFRGRRAATKSTTFVENNYRRRQNKRVEVPVEEARHSAR